jgi:hypothetical protein
LKSSAKKIELASVDDLFSTEESRQDEQLEKIQEIPLSELHPFKDHPFKVKDDDAMIETADSIKKYGVLVPAIARSLPDGGYELVAGHRRRRASELAGKETMPVIVRDLDDDAATIIMVDSNLQRENLLPSERAFAYKMKLEAIKHQGARTDLTSVQVEQKLSARDQVAKEAGERSGIQVMRYVRLTELIPELLDMVDEKKIAFNPAYELSFLKPDEQQMLVETMDYEQAMPELSRMKAVLQICDDNDLGRDSVKYAPLSMIETLQEAAYQQMQAEVSQMTASFQLPEAQEQALDEYPTPDEQVSTPDMQEYGYSYDGMLPVTRERALELDAAGLTVYVLHEDNTESMVFDPQEIMEHGGLFGVDREEWEKSPQFHEKVMERQEHQQEREQVFLSQNRDCFAIYQVSRDDPQNVRFMNLDWLKSHGISIDRSNYDLIYTAPLSESGTVPEQLEKLYQQFNLEKPVDFHSPSMSVSDIVAIKQDGKVSCHYCDSVGFTQIPGFFSQNPLKNAEMTVEDDYGMIDGIINNGAKEPTVAELEQQARSGQPISLMDLADAVHREEREKKKSVVNQLKSQPKAEHKKTAQKKSAEREI